MAINFESDMGDATIMQPKTNFMNYEKEIKINK